MATGDLTTVEQVRGFLGIKELSSDAILGSLVASSSAWARSRLGWNPLLASYTDTVSGDGKSCAVALRYAAVPRSAPMPPVAVSSVTVDGVALDPSAYELDGWQVRLLDGAVFASGTRNVVIAYTCGWVTVPTDLEQAVIEHVALRYRDRGRVGLSSESGGGESAAYSNAGTLAYVEGVLDAYRPLVVG